MRGGLVRLAASGRRSRTRRITSIRDDVRINGRLWDLAEDVLTGWSCPYPTGQAAG